MPFIKLLIALFFFNLPSILNAGNYRFSHIEAADGLAHNKVNSIFKDRDGFIWIGTATGLNRYDGYTLNLYREIPDDTTSMKYNYINDIQQDPRGFIWIHSGDAYIKYDPSTDSFDNNPVETFKKMGITGTPQSVHIADGCIWAHVANEGLYCFSTGKAELIKGIAENDTSINAW